MIQPCSCTDKKRPLTVCMDLDDTQYEEAWVHKGSLLHKECAGLRRVCGAANLCNGGYCWPRRHVVKKNRDDPTKGELYACSDKNCTFPECCQLTEDRKKAPLPELCCNMGGPQPPQTSANFWSQVNADWRQECREEARTVRHKIAPRIFSFLELHGNSELERNGNSENTDAMKRAVAKRFGIEKVTCNSCQQVIFECDPIKTKKEVSIKKFSISPETKEAIAIAVGIIALAVLICCIFLLSYPGLMERLKRAL